MELLQRLANELPTILVAMWGIARTVGIDLDETDQAVIGTAVESLVAFALWLLVRRKVDGPVTLFHANRHPSER